MGGGRRVELRAEFFNITNTPKWRNPLGTTAQDIGGTISMTNAGFGRNYNVAGERQIRFGLRFSFQRARDFPGTTRPARTNDVARAPSLTVDNDRRRRDPL